MYNKILIHKQPHNSCTQNQTFLEECKYIQEKIKTKNYIDKDLEKSESESDSNDETESDIDNDE